MSKNNLVVGMAGLVLVSAAGVHWKLTREMPAYEVARVIDGDTFETREKQLIRLAEADAPELNLCGGAEAKQQLEKLIKNKPVYLKVMYRDKYMRLVSYVYTPEGFVNEKMNEDGYAVYDNKYDTKASAALKAATERARKSGAGVYGTKCTQKENGQSPQCVIKGNIRAGFDTRIYSLPECESYASTLIQMHLGDRWFCSEAEARAAGFVKAGGCK